MMARTCHAGKFWNAVLPLMATITAPGFTPACSARPPAAIICTTTGLPCPPAKVSKSLRGLSSSVYLKEMRRLFAPAGFGTALLGICKGGDLGIILLVFTSGTVSSPRPGSLRGLTSVGSRTSWGGVNVKLLPPRVGGEGRDLKDADCRTKEVSLCSPNSIGRSSPWA